jgi:hypothetical protein
MGKWWKLTVEIGFQCPTCNAAMSIAERQTWYAIGAMATLTVLSFTWFASGIVGIF